MSCDWIKTKIGWYKMWPRQQMFLHCNVWGLIRVIFFKSCPSCYIQELWVSPEEDSFVTLRSQSINKMRAQWKQKKSWKMQLIIDFEILEQRLVLSQDFTVRDCIALKSQGSSRRCLYPDICYKLRSSEDQIQFWAP